jgi:hypothetical protein
MNEAQVKSFHEAKVKAARAKAANGAKALMLAIEINHPLARYIEDLNKALGNLQALTKNDPPLAQPPKLPEGA